FKGELQRAEEVLLQNHQVLENLPADFPCREFWFQKTLADNHSRLGWVYLNTGRADNAKQEYAQASQILEKLAVSQEPNCMSDLANVYLNQATLLRAAGRLPEAKKRHEQAIVLAKKLIADYPQVPDSEFELAQQQHELGVTLRTMGRSAEAEPLFQQSIASLNKLVQQLPRKQTYKKELALCWIDFVL